MKRIMIGLTGILIACGLLLNLPLAAAASPNLAPNPSLETAASATQPQSWQTGGWGTNTRSFNYLSTGHTGSRSVKVSLGSHTSGDAKWYFTPVTVSPSTAYTYSDHYQATVTTRIVVQVTTTGGGTSYIELSPAAATSGSTWSQTTQHFKTPANATSVTIFHLLDKVGSLTLDDVSLAKQTTPTPNPATNLVANPSVEQVSTSNTSLPTAWTNNNWGTNAATFSYPNTGYTGSRSVKVQVSNYVSGDAKWHFTPITVNPGAYYLFSDWYQSNVPTNVIAQFTKTDGTLVYSILGTTPASTAWAQAQYQIAIPANVTQLSVFHVIAANGYLTTDDTSVTPLLATPSDSNPVPNPSLETAAGTQPTAWTPSMWGTNTASFEYANEGHTGNRSAKVTISSYTSGDAKWIFDSQPLTVGSQYRFTGWYKTNTQPHVVAMFNKTDGTQQYFGMPQPLPSSAAATTWQRYTDTFTVPANTVSVSVFMFINSTGWLQIDDYSIEPYQPTGFNRPLVTLTFDDGHEDNIQTALPAMAQKGFKSTQCYATEFVEGVTGGPENVQAFKNAGHEICSHTVTHPFLTQISSSQLTYELTHSQQYLQQLTGNPINNIASPYGDYNTTVLNAIKPLYRSHRSVDEGFNSKDNFDIYRVRVQNMKLNTSPAQFQSWLTQAKATNTWLVLVYHRVVPTGTANAEEFDTTATDFTQQMNALQASGLTVKTYNQALDEVTTQL